MRDSGLWNYVIGAYGAVVAVIGGYFIYLRGQLRDVEGGRRGRAR